MVRGYLRELEPAPMGALGLERTSVEDPVQTTTGSEGRIGQDGWRGSAVAIGRAAKIESRLLMEESVEKCTVNIAEKKASLTGSIDPEKAAEIITEMGYPAKVI